MEEHYSLTLDGALNNLNSAVPYLKSTLKNNQPTDATRKGLTELYKQVFENDQTTETLMNFANTYGLSGLIRPQDTSTKKKSPYWESVGESDVNIAIDSALECDNVTFLQILLRDIGKKISKNSLNKIMFYAAIHYYFPLFKSAIENGADVLKKDKMVIYSNYRFHPTCPKVNILYVLLDGAMKRKGIRRFEMFEMFGSVREFANPNENRISLLRPFIQYLATKTNQLTKFKELYLARDRYTISPLSLISAYNLLDAGVTMLDRGVSVKELEDAEKKGKKWGYQPTFMFRILCNLINSDPTASIASIASIALVDVNAKGIDGQTLFDAIGNNTKIKFERKMKLLEAMLVSEQDDETEDLILKTLKTQYKPTPSDVCCFCAGLKGSPEKIQHLFKLTQNQLEKVKKASPDEQKYYYELAGYFLPYFTSDFLNHWLSEAQSAEYPLPLTVENIQELTEKHGTFEQVKNSKGIKTKLQTTPQAWRILFQHLEVTEWVRGNCADNREQKQVFYDQMLYCFVELTP